jgi:thiol-disulfide isomerase/thioredoxin
VEKHPLLGFILLIPAIVVAVFAAGLASDSIVQKKDFSLLDSAMNAAPPFERDDKGNRKQLDFSLTLRPISNPDILFSHFSNRNLVIFYFSPKCMHCRKAFPYIQSLAGEISEARANTIAIAVRNSTENDVRNFIRKQNCSLPVFHDTDRSFGLKYGTGNIPIVVAVNRYGEYIIFKDFDSSTTPGQVKKLFAKQP